MEPCFAGHVKCTVVFWVVAIPSYQQRSVPKFDPRLSHPAVPELAPRSPQEDPAKVLRGSQQGYASYLKVPMWDPRFGIFKCSSHPATVRVKSFEYAQRPRRLRFPFHFLKLLYPHGCSNRG